MNGGDYVILLVPWLFYFLMIFHLRTTVYKKLKEIDKTLSELRSTPKEGS